MLGELVYNLLDNAVKYNRENGSVVALLEENADGSRSLTVSDCGVGIDPADQSTCSSASSRRPQPFQRGRHGAGPLHRQARGARARGEGVLG